MVNWSRSFGHFRFRERGHCSLYINKIFIYSGGFDKVRFDFDHRDHDILTAQMLRKQNVFPCIVLTPSEP